MPGLARIPYKKELNRGLDQRESAAGDDAFLDSGAGGGQRVLDLGGRADVDDPDRLGLAELADVGLLELEVDLLGDESFWTLINSRRGEMAMSSNIEGMQEGEHGDGSGASHASHCAAPPASEVLARCAPGFSGTPTLF
jgi:hypothetical protein